jgi:isopenicillin-N epimerase
MPHPTFGAALRDRWLLDPAVTYLNHGTVGATPRAVLERQRQIQDEIERQPAKFLLRELADPHAEGLGRTPRLREAAAAVAEFVGLGADDELVFVDNITAGANAVLRSFPFRPEDEIVVTSLGYGGIVNAATFAARDRGCILRCLDMPRPGAPVDRFYDTVVDGLSAATRVLIVDHLSASTALLLPLAEIAEECHRRGVLVRLAPPSASSNPSPPSASAISVQSCPSSQHACPIACATSAALAVPLNLSTAATTRMPRT